jgi:hypothetical protein
MANRLVRQPYSTSAVPNQVGPELLPWIANEFARIARSLGTDQQLHLATSYMPPDRAEDGMMVYADGMDWDPGDGEGLYRWNAATEAWEIITGNSSGGTSDHNQLVNRDQTGQHPIGAITDLQTTLDGKEPSLGNSPSDGNYYSLFTGSFFGTEKIWARADAFVTYEHLVTNGDVGPGPNQVEDGLGVPTVDGQILSSSIAGVRAWVDPPSGGGGISTIWAEAEDKTFGSLTSEQMLPFVSATVVNSGNPDFVFSSGFYTTFTGVPTLITIDWNGIVNASSSYRELDIIVRDLFGAQLFKNTVPLTASGSAEGRVNAVVSRAAVLPANVEHYVYFQQRTGTISPATLIARVTLTKMQ